MSYNFHLLFYLKRPKNFIKGEMMPIYLRITVKGKHSEYSVGREIVPSFWSALKGKGTGLREEIRELNDYLDTLASKVRRFHTTLVEKEDEVTAVVLRDHLTGKNTSNHSLLRVYQKHNDNMEKLIGKGYSYSTFQTYQNSIRHVMQFLQLKYEVQDINIKKVDFKFITDYELFLRIDRGNNAMSARKYIVHLKIPKFSDEKGREQASILKIDQDVYLRKLNFGINRRHFKSIKLRLNVYGIKNGIPDHSLLDKDVVFDVSGSSEQGMPKVQTIDLRPYQIEIKGRKEIAVSLSIIELQSLPGDTSRQAFFIPSFPNPLRSSLYRMKSEAIWQKVSSSHLLIGIEVSTMKAKKVEEEEQKEENLDEITKVDPEISRALYGNNNGKRIKVADGEIYYETYGKGSPLILLHGNSESISSFRNQIGPLSEHYQVIAMDTRGYGNSINRNATAYSYRLFADDLKA